MSEHVDCVVIGAGVVGLACGAALAAAGREVIVLERAGLIGSETSSRNSEVIHAGIYYQPGSLKARLCRDGKARLYAYCAARGVPHRRLGKIIVGAGPEQDARLEAIRANAAANQVSDLEWLTAADIARLEPEVKGHRALFSPSTGIVDSHALMLALEGDLTTQGGMVVLGADVEGGVCGEDGIMLHVGGAEPMELTARTVVNCAGLHAPALAAKLHGLAPDHVPTAYYAKGHYFRLSGRAPFAHLVYPVPEPGGLGIHLTLDLGGQAKFGPDVSWIDAADYSFDESRFARFVEAIRTYFPALDAERLHADYTGIRPKIASPGMADADFRIDDSGVHGVPGLVNLFGIESPGLTASLAIADEVMRRLTR